MDKRNEEAMIYILTIADNLKVHIGKLLRKKTEITKQDICELSKMLSGFSTYTYRIGTAIDDLESDIKSISKTLALARSQVAELSLLVKKENQGTKH